MDLDKSRINVSLKVVMMSRRVRGEEPTSFLPEPFHFVAILNATLHRLTSTPQPICARPWRKTVKAISARKPLGAARWNGTFLVGSAWHMFAERENTSSASRTGRVPLTRRQQEQQETKTFRTVERDNCPRKQLAPAWRLIPSFGMSLLLRFPRISFEGFISLHEDCRLDYFKSD